MKGNLYTENEKFKKKIKVGRTFYKIYYCDVLKLNNKSFFGFIDYKDKSIYLKKDKDIKKTLKHELLHAFMYEVYRISKNKNIKKLKSNELFIERLRNFIDNFY